jgi:1-acyl-sn-glycerol-3-phosphate acyltransferase
VLAAVGKPLARLAFRPRVRGREHLAAGGFVLGANHLSGFDSLALVFALYPRAFRSMAKVQLFERPLLGRLVRSLGAFPARGGTNRAAQSRQRLASRAGASRS